MKKGDPGKVEDSTRTARDRVIELLGSVSPEARQLVGEVLRLEQAQIHLKVASGIAGDIVDIVADAIANAAMPRITPP